MMRPYLFSSLCLLLTVSPLVCGTAMAQELRNCLSTAQAREAIAHNQLLDSFAAMRAAAADAGGEALTSRLCKRKNDYVFDVSLLRKDGHVVHVTLNAVSGEKILPHKGPAAANEEETD